MAKGAQRIDESSQQDKPVVLVTGGSGFLGKHLVKTLADSKRTVVTMYRHKLPEPMPNVYPVCTDLESVDLLKAPLRGVETVIHLAWDETFAGSGDAKSGAGLESKNVLRLQNMIEAMEHVGTKRMILVSANGASREAKSAFLKEKYVTEHLLINSKISEKIILRPTILFEGSRESDRFVRSIANITKLPGIYPVPKVGGKIAPVHVQDCCEVLKNITQMDFPSGVAILELVGGEKYTVREIFRMVADRYNKGAKLQITGGIGDALSKFVDKSRNKQAGSQVGQILAVSHDVCKHTRKANPMVRSLPRDFRSFREALKD